MAGKRIDEHTLRVLEFEEVKIILASFAASDLGRDAAKSLYPSVERHWVQARIAETTELAKVLERGERVPMAGLRDIRPVLKEFGKKQTVLEPAELIEISDTLAASGRLRLFLTNLERSSSGCGCDARIGRVERVTAPTDATSGRNEPRNRSTPDEGLSSGCDHLIAMGEKLGDFQPTVDEIGRCIGGDKRVRDDASAKLKEIRRRIGQLSETIHQRFMSIIAVAGYA